jgi:signal transduction histidine kinase
MLYQLAKTLLQTLDLDQIISRVLEGALTLCPAQTAAIILLDTQGIPARCVASDPDLHITNLQIAAAMYDGFQSEAIRQREIMLIDDAEQHKDDGKRLLTGRSLLVAPFYANNDTVGVLTLSHPEPGIFSAEDKALLNEAAPLMSNALSHATLYSTLRADATAYEDGRYRLIHDIRSPLTALSASLEVIKRALKMHPVHESIHDLVQESIQSGQHSLHSVIELTNNLLDTKRLQIGPESLEYQSIAIELIFGGVSDVLKDMSVQRRVMIRYQVTPRTLHVPGDEQFVRRMLLNLTSNALRFTPEGGVVTLRAYKVPASNSVMLAIEDTGPGIPQEDRERIFQPFVQGKGEGRRGTGLGLTICREIARAHQGRIWVEDQVGGGSRFCVLLPAKQPTIAITADTDADTESTTDTD